MTLAEAFRPIPYPGVELAGSRVHLVDDRATEDILRPLLREPAFHHLITANVSYLREAASDPTLRAILNEADLVVPDGKPVVWTALMAGHGTHTSRVTGHDIVDALAMLSATGEGSLFLLGAEPGVAHRAADSLRAFYPGVRIVGVHSPPILPYPFPEYENDRMIEAVNESGATALVVALGCPKQDRWLAAYRDVLNVRVAVGVGCVLDVLAGNFKRAPGWMQASGIEWAYRLYQEPSRLWRRYAKDALFISRLFLKSAYRRLRSRPAG